MTSFKEDIIAKFSLITTHKAVKLYMHRLLSLRDVYVNKLLCIKCWKISRLLF